MKILQNLEIEIARMPNETRIIKTYKIPSKTLNKFMILISSVILIFILVII